MKFQKFVKSLGSNGVIYIRPNGERWLSSSTALMKIPDTIRSITATDNLPMPEILEHIINEESFAIPCGLRRAAMPFGNGGIKDCIRIYGTPSGANEIPIRNSDYMLLEKYDEPKLYIERSEEKESETKALLIRFFTTSEFVGIILPVNWEEEQ